MIDFSHIECPRCSGSHRVALAESSDRDVVLAVVPCGARRVATRLLRTALSLAPADAVAQAVARAVRQSLDDLVAFEASQQTEYLSAFVGDDGIRREAYGKPGTNEPPALIVRCADEQPREGLPAGLAELVAAFGHRDRPGVVDIDVDGRTWTLRRGDRELHYVEPFDDEATTEARRFVATCRRSLEIERAGNAAVDAAAHELRHVAEERLRRDGKSADEIARILGELDVETDRLLNRGSQAEN